MWIIFFLRIRRFYEKNFLFVNLSACFIVARLVLFLVEFLIKHRESYTIVVALILERDRSFFPFKYTGVADKSSYKYIYIYICDKVGYIKVKK